MTSACGTPAHVAAAQSQCGGMSAAGQSRLCISSQHLREGQRIAELEAEIDALQRRGAKRRRSAVCAKDLFVAVRNGVAVGGD